MPCIAMSLWLLKAATLTTQEYIYAFILDRFMACVMEPSACMAMLTSKLESSSERNPAFL